MSDPEYVAIEYAGRVTGVPARTLRRWAEAGKVPVIAGQRKRFVRL
jgi:predicted site-specific integrase-resolvase